MKRLLVLFAIIAVGLITLNAQTVIKTDQVRTYVYGDTLKKTVDSVFNVVYYGKDFIENVRIQVNADSFSSGYTKLELTVRTSLDNANWTAHADTITLSATGADSDVNMFSTLYWDYFDVKVRSIDSVQNTTVNWNILFDVND